MSPDTQMDLTSGGLRGGGGALGWGEGTQVGGAPSSSEKVGSIAATAWVSHLAPPRDHSLSHTLAISAFFRHAHPIKKKVPEKFQGAFY